MEVRMAHRDLPAHSGGNKSGLVMVKHATATSLSLPAKLSFSEWREIGIQLWRAAGTLCWLIGDWWVFGAHCYGGRVAIVQAEDWVGRRNLASTRGFGFFSSSGSCGAAKETSGSVARSVLARGDTAPAFGPLAARGGSALAVR